MKKAKSKIQTMFWECEKQADLEFVHDLAMKCQADLGGPGNLVETISRWTLEKYHQEKGAGFRIMLAQVGLRPAGFVILKHFQDAPTVANVKESVIVGLAIDEPFRNSGLFKELLGVANLLQMKTKDPHDSALTGLVNADRPALIRLLESLGFEAKIMIMQLTGKKRLPRRNDDKGTAGLIEEAKPVQEASVPPSDKAPVSETTAADYPDEGRKQDTSPMDDVTSGHARNPIRNHPDPDTGSAGKNPEAAVTRSDALTKEEIDAALQDGVATMLAADEHERHRPHEFCKHHDVGLLDGFEEAVK